MIITALYEKLEAKRTHDYEKQYDLSIDYASRLPKPKDDIDMAFCHYYAHSHFYYNLPIRLMLNIIGVFSLPAAWLLCLAKSRNNVVNVDEHNDLAVVKKSSIGINDIIPSELYRLYDEIVEEPFINKRLLDTSAKCIIKKTWRRYPFSPFFVFMVIRRLSEICSVKYDFNPKAIVTYGRERDFVTPIVSHYCEGEGIEHIGFMHGDDYYTPDKIYMRHTKYYVWDDHYVNMYTRLLWPRAQFVVYRPKKLSGIIKIRENDDYDYYITYYFSGENKEIIEGVRKAFDIIAARGNKCKVRPHPRFSDIGTLKRVFENYFIEDTNKTSLEESMECSKYICALNSTVLSQAYYSGKNIVIDDYSSKKRYESLIPKDYILLSKPHCLLSELLGVK